MKRLTDPDFKYVDSAHTNIRETFKRVRLELDEAKALAESCTPAGYKHPGGWTEYTACDEDGKPIVLRLDP